MAQPNWRPDARTRDPALFVELHNRWRECALCGATDSLSLHHVLKRADDVVGNLVMLCGDGVRGCHGCVEVHDRPTLHALATYIIEKRPDTMAYLITKMGPTAAADWLRRQMDT